MEAIRDKLQAEAVKRADARILAYENLDTWLAKQIERKRRDAPQVESRLDEFGFDLEFIESATTLLEMLHSTINSQFSGDAQGERIEFEITFMTLAPSDGKIVVAAWANKHRRMPRSLNMRKNNVDVYKSTVTAEVYKMEKPRSVIVENTSTSDYYKELYEGEKEKIQSTIVHPILNLDNNVCGTIVCHCDSTGFFKQSDKRYWEGIMEIYAKRIYHLLDS